AVVGVQQVEGLVPEVPEADVVHGRPGQPAAVDATLDEVAGQVFRPGRRPADDVDAPLDLQPAPGVGRLPEPVRLPDGRVVQEVGVVEGDPAGVVVRGAARAGVIPEPPGGPQGVHQVIDLLAGELPQAALHAQGVEQVVQVLRPDVGDHLFLGPGETVQA